MATSRENFIAKCDEIYNAQPAYKHGASDKSQCDCIGMIKYALRENGVKFSTTGSNYTARNHTTGLRAINSAADLHAGDIVLKALNPGDEGYALPEKYRQGGSQYNGDLRDYNHIGIVRSVNPLCIEHMTSPSAKRDSKIGRWKFTGSLKSEYVSGGEPSPSPSPTPEPSITEAIVYAESGTTVNMRKKPNGDLLERVPIGTAVQVLEPGDPWSKIAYTDKRKARWVGYMMSKFLISEAPPVEETCAIIIEGITLAEAQELKTKYPQATIEVG